MLFFPIDLLNTNRTPKTILAPRLIKKLYHYKKWEEDLCK